MSRHYIRRFICVTILAAVVLKQSCGQLTTLTNDVTTNAPVTNAQLNDVTTTNVPATDPPATFAPSTVAPSTGAPSTDAPSTVAPSSVAPVSIAPTTDDAPASTVASKATPTYLPEDTIRPTIITLPNNDTGCKDAKADIHFLLDASGSIGLDNYQKQLEWVKSFAQQFTIGPDDVQVGVTTFSSSAHNEFWMNSHHSAAALLHAVDGIGYAAQTTHTELGLEFVRQHAFTSQHGDRPGVSNILIVVTDGKSVSPISTQVEAADLHKLNINTIAVGVGSGVDQSELATIASYPANVYTVSNFDALSDIQAQIRQATCNEAATSKCNAPIDLVMLVDKSASIHDPQWLVEKDFVTQMIQQFHVSPSEVQVALALFANHVRHKWCFTNYTTQAEVMQAVSNLSCPECDRGQTATGHALQWATDYMLTNRCGARRNAQKVVVVLTDGHSTEKPESVLTNAARNLRRTGATVITVGVGPRVGVSELQKIASDPQYVFTAKDFSALLPLLTKVANTACRAPDYNQVCEASIDLTLLVDKSESRNHFITEKTFLEQLVGEFEIGPQFTQVALAQYATSVNPAFCFDDHVTTDELQKAIQHLGCHHDCHNGDAVTAQALTYARVNIIKNTCGKRPNTTQVVVVLTDSPHTEQDSRFINAATNLKLKANVIAVGVGNKVPHTQLEMIASNDSLVFTPTDYTHLQSVIDAVASAACGLAPVPEPNAAPIKCSAEQKEKACEIFQMEEDGGVVLARFHQSGVYDSATAYNNVLDMCDGKKSSRSSYACADCPTGSPGGAVCISDLVLTYLLKLTLNGTFTVNQLTGGCAACDSAHYQGLAVQVAATDLQRHASFVQECTNLGGAANDSGVSVTCVFPSTTSTPIG